MTCLSAAPQVRQAALTAEASNKRPPLLPRSAGGLSGRRSVASISWQGDGFLRSIRLAAAGLSRQRAVLRVRTGLFLQPLQTRSVTPKGTAWIIASSRRRVV